MWGWEGKNDGSAGTDPAGRRAGDEGGDCPFFKNRGFRGGEDALSASGDCFASLPEKLWLYFSMGEEEKKEAGKYYQSLFAQAVEREADLLILDEILPACQAGLVGKQEVEDFLKEHSPGLEVVLTGRKAWREILDMADYVTEMKAVKHPYACKTLARRGIEY